MTYWWVLNVVELPRPRTKDAKERRKFSSFVKNFNRGDLDKLGLLSRVTEALSLECGVVINGNVRDIFACADHSEWRAECKIPDDVEREVIEPRKDVHPHPCMRLRIVLLFLVGGGGGESIELSDECSQALANVELELSDIVRREQSRDHLSLSCMLKAASSIEKTAGDAYERIIELAL